MKNQQDSLLRKISFMAIFYFLGLSVVFAQNKTIKGTVSDDSGESLPGVTVVIKGSQGGVITDADGKFEIQAPTSGILIFSFIGMQTQEVILDGRNTYLIQMVPLPNELDDVTVVAFAKQKKESVISAITTVSPKELKIPVSNLTNALAGKMAGIISYQQSGEPGKDNAQFFIRGVTTFGYKKDPLILIDNIELSADDLARLNVDDIAQFSIMKDATATALYGARGANGVILVTTKEGKEGKAKVSIRMEHSISEPTQMVKLADPITYMRMNNEAIVARNPALGSYYKYSQEKIDNTIAGVNPYVYPAVNWYDELLKDRTNTERVNANISGGGDVAKYFIAASYAKDNGVLKNDKINNFNSNIDLNKYTIRSNVNLNLTKTTEAIVRVSGSFDDYSGPIDGGADVFNKVMRTNPVMFPKSFPAVGEYERATHILFGNAVQSGGSGTGPEYLNPYADMVRGYKEYNRTLISAQIEARQDISSLIKGLKARVLFNTTRYSYSDVSRKYNPFYYAINMYDRPTDTYSLKSMNQGTEYLDYNEGAKDVTTTNYMEMSLDYNNAFGDHNVSGMLVLTMQDRKISNAGNIQKSLAYRNQGLAGRFTYAYASKYFAEFNFGYNGSERFAVNERFGFFPSIGAGYIISNESFWEPWLKVANKLKFKFTYGLVGNDAIGNEDDRFFYLSNLNMGDWGKYIDFGRDFSNPQGKPGISIIRYPNNLITWERSKKLNAGFELGLFNNMIDIQADFFHEYRDHILQTRSHIPTTMGLQSSAIPKANIGEASSQGIDFSVDYSFISQKDFWASARVNFTYAISEYKVLEEPDYASQGRPWSSAIGRNFSQRNGYIAERLFVDEADVANSPLQSFGEYGAGDIKYKDINDDGKITDADKVYFGYPTTPEITYGFGFSTGYKDFDLSMFFQGNSRVSFYLDPGKIAPFVGETALLDKIAKDHWSESNRDSYAFWPKLAAEHIDNNHQSSTWWMQNGAFFRVKTVEIGYSLPKKIIKALGMESCRLYLTGNNLFTLSKFKLWDPEMGDNGLGYPIQKVYNIGLNINF